MGSKKVAQARKSSSARNSSHSKSAKGKNDKNILLSGTRPKPHPAFKNAVVQPTSTRKDEAASVLVLMGNPSPALADRSVVEHDDEPKVADIETPAEYPQDDKDDSPEDEEEDDPSDSESEEDEDLDKVVAKVIPKLKIPAKVLNIPFVVPYKNGTRDLTGITSRTSFDDFLAQVAAKMHTRVSALNIGYIPSYKPRNPKPTPKLLEDDDSWDVLIADVHQHIKLSQGKNRGKGEVKPYNILVVDMDKVEDAKGKVKGGKKGPKSKKDDSDDQSAPTPALKEHDLFKRIEKQHYCQECKSACVVLDSGEHHVLTHPELATWAMLASRHEAVMSEPPSQLDLGVNHARQKRAKNHRANTSSNLDQSTPAWLQTLAPVLGALINRPPAILDWQQSQYNMPVADPRISVHGPYSMQAGPPSVGTKRPAEDASALDVCPDIATWLTGLDADPNRGRLNLNFSQYQNLLLENGFYEPSDIANVLPEQLQKVLGGGMTFGLANRLITHAKEDFTPVSTKRARVD